ncbi:putative DNA helicase [Listeria phage LP-037]|uniref:SF4 helicase domain-containing protein n=6 Tax=Homburgvirus TaxID=1921125 RepID=A0A6C0QZS1_9CAUD|nr:putative DNA helicase [Listeria phage LP-037]YP_009045069.1 putative DNA helicase [Listeria phage LP-114]QDK04541.1 hypothetical protein FK481_0027 [Listeria phage LP-010]QDK04649.1 hypothetical protein FK482_0027 [Listeria phage LP-013]QDK04760.1 hypothetical protein FK484_0027 [Listeria phage LP-031]QHZ59370.1 hypothetical protein FK483_0027 [Listeria phage LP-018]AGI11626.1 putative DNA helicase [Listeria phage LP-037]
MAIYYGTQFLSRIIEDDNIRPLAEFGIKEKDFLTQAEKETYLFIKQYHDRYGKCPDAETVVTKYPEFGYMPAIDATFEYMARETKNYNLAVETVNFINDEVLTSFDSYNSVDDFWEFVNDRAKQMQNNNAMPANVGADIINDFDWFQEEYRNIQTGVGRKTWDSSFPTINKEVGGYNSGNCILWFGRSGRGKSLITLQEAIKSAIEGATVLIYNLEMSKYEYFTRAYSIITAMYKKNSVKLGIEEYLAGYSVKALMNGKLSIPDEEDFAEAMADIMSKVMGRIIVRSANEPGFDSWNCDQLEDDIVNTNADVVLIDAFYLLEYENNSSRTAGGAAAETSKRVRKIAAKHNIVMHLITQAEELKISKDERELLAPTRDQVKKTSSLLEDCAVVIAFDSMDKNFIVEIVKGRTGGENVELTGVWLPSYGLIHEIEPSANKDLFI